MGSATEKWTQPGAIIVTGTSPPIRGQRRATRCSTRFPMSLTKCGDDDGACDKVQWADVPSRQGVANVAK